MVDYRGGIRTSNDIRSTVFGVNLGSVIYMQLNDESIYDSEMFVVLTEVNSNINMDTFAIYLNYRLNFGRFGLYMGYLSTGEQKGMSVERKAFMWLINIEADTANIDATTILVISSSENTSLSQRKMTS